MHVSAAGVNPSDLPSASAIALGELMAASFSRVEREFDRALRSDLPPVQRLVEHLESYRGKMLRPALVVLSGLAAHPDAPAVARALDAGADASSRLVTDAHIKIAAVCEMIHMATLVHDDVLDEADIRRKGATVNRLHGNEAAVILGDYLFSTAFSLCSSLDSQAASLLIGQTGMTLCAGELLQLHHRENYSIDEPTYFEIVRRKTGSLIAVACRLGAMQSRAATGADDVCTRMERVGMDLGVAFQIQDDLLDLTGNQAVVGKPLRRDLELGKLTLPVIHHLATATPTQRGRTLAMLDDAPGMSAALAKSLLDALEITKSIQHARDEAARLVARAKANLAALPDTPARALMLTMADQVVSRSS
ncbi:MAG: polyprenyl synthetase family protein [Phycisphaerales bacterium]|nr:polyprenyl synthetase family protein [Phycisphaerales bacterium]